MFFVRFFLYISVLCSACAGDELIDAPVAPFSSDDWHISPASVGVLANGGMTYLTLEGTTIDAYPVQWTSDDPSIATIENGTVQGVGVGQTRVTATVEGVVLEAWVGSVATQTEAAFSEMKGLRVELARGASMELNVGLYDVRGGVLPVTSTTYHVEPPSLLALQNGKTNTFEGIASGKARVYAIVDGLRTSSGIVHVVSPGDGRVAVLAYPAHGPRALGSVHVQVRADARVLVTIDPDFQSDIVPMTELVFSKSGVVDRNVLRVGLLDNQGGQAFVLDQGAGLYTFDWVLVWSASANVVLARGRLTDVVP